MAYQHEPERIAGARLTEEARHQDQLRRDIFTAERAFRDSTRFSGTGRLGFGGMIVAAVVAYLAIRAHPTPTVTAPYVNEVSFDPKLLVQRDDPAWAYTVANHKPPAGFHISHNPITDKEFLLRNQ
jgi:hypothetical protein